MPDFHVEALHYKLEVAPGLEFREPPPLTGDTVDFSYRLENAVLVVTMKTHLATEEEARVCVEPFLRAWELDNALFRHRRYLTFKFDRSEVIDREPRKPGEPIVLHVKPISILCLVDVANVVVSQPTYPAPPAQFVASPEAENMWFRYDRCIHGGEPLTSMGYFCLTQLTTTAGNRNDAALQYSIESKVLSELGRLTTTRGNVTEARKVEAGAMLTDLTEAEKTWILSAVRALIRRKGEYDANPTGTFKRITMADIT